MNWKAEAVEKLRKYDAMCRAVANLPEQIRQLKDQAVTVPTGVLGQSGGSSDIRRREEWLTNNLVKRQELQHALEQAELWLCSMDRALGVLSAQERLILHTMYICPQKGAVQKLCGKLGLEKSSIYRRRDKALDKFTVALYGMEESK